MFKNLTYKQKLVGLGFLAVILFLTANKRSFSVTKNAYAQVQDLEKKIDYISTSNQGIDEMQNELAFYDKVIGKQGVRAEEVQQKILDYSTEQLQTNLVSIEEIHVAESNNFTIITNQLLIEGDFNALLEAVYNFEKKFKYSKIVSISFDKIKEYQTRKDKLRVKIIFQNYEKTN